MNRPLSLLLSLTLSLSSFSLSSLSLPTLANADGASDAKDLFARGRDLRAKGDCQGALPLFRKAYSVYPAGLGSLRNAAECEEKLSLWASARRDWLDLKRALLVVKDVKYAGWDADCDAAATRLAPKIARLVVRVTDAGGEDLSARGGLKVTLNEEAIERTLLGTDLERDPGAYVVVATLDETTGTSKATLVAGESKAVTVTLTLPAKPLVPPPVVEVENPTPTPTPAPETPITDHDRGATMRTFGYVGVALGGAFAIGTIAAIAVRSSALSSVSNKCPDYTTAACGPSVRDDVDRGKSAATLVNVFGALTLVSVGVGATLILTNPKPDRPPVALSPLFLVGGGGAAISGGF